MLDAKREIMEKMEKPWVKYVIIFVVIILVANVTSTLTQNQTLAELQPLQEQIELLKEQVELLKTQSGEQSELLQKQRELFDTRLAEIDAKTGGLLDLAEVKANAEALQKAAENFDARLNAIVKAEGAKLEILEKDLANQKTYVEELGKLMPEETEK